MFSKCFFPRHFFSHRVSSLSSHLSPRRAHPPHKYSYPLHLQHTTLLYFLSILQRFSLTYFNLRQRWPLPLLLLPLLLRLARSPRPFLVLRRPQSLRPRARRLSARQVQGRRASPSSIPAVPPRLAARQPVGAFPSAHRPPASSSSLMPAESLCHPGWESTLTLTPARAAPGG